MPSELVDGVRALIRAREEDGRPLTALERTLLLATLAPRRTGGADAVDELEAAIAHARTVLLGTPPAVVDELAVVTARRRAVARLLAAARGILDHEPPEHDTTAAAGEAIRPPRADIDG